MVETSTKFALNEKLHKLAFAVFAMLNVDVITLIMKYEGGVYVQLSSVIVITFLSTTAAVEWRSFNQVVDNKVN